MQRKRWMAWMLSAAVAMTSIGQTGVLAADFTDEAVSVTETAESDEAVSESEEPEGTEEAAGTDEAAESESEDAGSEGSVTEEAAEIEAADTEEETAAEAEVTIETEAETKAETAPETETAESVSEETEEAALFTAGEEASAVGDGEEYEAYFDYSYGSSENSVLFSGEDNALTLALAETENSAEWPEVYDVSWSVEKVIDDETGETEELDESPVSFVLSDNNEAVTLTATESDDLEFNVKVTAQITYNEETLTETKTWVWVRNPLYKYDLPADEPGECDLLPGWTYTIDPTMNCYVENRSYPDGEYVDVEITGLGIVAQGDWDEDGNEVERDDLKVLTCGERDGGGWVITAEEYGWAKLALTYISLEDNQTKETEYIWFYVYGDKYSLEFTYPEDTDNMLKNSKMEIETRLFHEWRDDDGYDNEYITDYDLELQVNDDESYSYNTNLLDVSISGEGEIKSVSIESGQDTTNGYEDIWLTAYLIDENGESYEVRSDYISVQVLDGYQLVLPVELTDENGKAVNPGLGETLDFDKYEVKVVERWTDDDGKAQEDDVTEKYVLSLDEEQVDTEESFEIVKDEDDTTSFPTLKRIGTEGDNLRIVVKEAQTDDDGNTVYDEVLEKWYWIDGLDYEISFDHSYGDDGENSLLFGGTPLTLTAQAAENTREWPEDSSIKYTVEKVTGEGEEETRETLSNKEGDAVTYTTDENGALVLKADSSAELDFNIVVTASLMYGEKEIISGETWLWARKPSYDYDFPADEPGECDLLPGGGYGIDSTMICHVEDAAHPGGKDVEVKITDIAVGTQYNADEKEITDGTNIVTVEPWEDESGWTVYAGEEIGYAELTLTYVSAKDGSNQTETIEFWVQNDCYSLELALPASGNTIIKGESIAVEANLYHEWLEDGEFQEEYMAADSWQLAVNDDEGTNEMMTALTSSTESKDDTWTITFTGTACTEGNLWLNASVKNEETNKYDFVMNNYFYLCVTDEYTAIEPVELDVNPWVGDELDLTETEFKTVRHYTDENGEADTEELSDVTYRLEYDENYWSVKEGTEGDSIPVLIRDRALESVVVVIAENNEGDELTRWGYMFEEEYRAPGYTFSYGSLDEHSFGTVLTDVPLTVSLNTGNLGNLTGYSVEWKVNACELNEDGDVESLNGDAEAVTWSVSDDGTAVTLQGVAGEEGQPVWIHAEMLYKDEVVAYQNAGAVVTTCTHNWNAGSVTTEATCTATGVKTYTCSVYGEQKTETIPAKGHTPGAAATCTAAQTCTVCGTVLANAAGHSWGEWMTVSEATVSNPEVRSHTCSVCGEKATEEYGSKLTPTIKFNAKSLKLQKKQKTTAFKVTFANGDSVKSWKSSNTKIVKVTGKADGTCTIKAKNKTGKAKITVTLASGLKKTVKVTVQKGKVKTTSVKVATKKVSLKKGKTYVIETTVAPITTQQKTTYKSSNKKIAAVNKNGKITAKKKGTCTITVKSGNKSVKIKVTVN